MKHSVKVYRRWIRQRQMRGLHVPDMKESLKNKDAEIANHRCLHCGTEYLGKFCPNCGQSSKTNRFTIKGAIKDAATVLAKFDTGFMHTIISLFYRPGYMIREYLEGHRVCYFKPLKLLVFLSTIYIVVRFLLPGMEDANSVVQLSKDGEMGLNNVVQSSVLAKWLKFAIDAFVNNKLVSALVTVVFFAPPAKLCFSRTTYGKRMNLAEHFYARVYISCQTMVLAILCLFVDAIFSISSQSGAFYNILNIFLIIWDYAQLMKIRMWKSMWLCVLTYSLMMTAIIMLMILFFVILALTGNVANL